MPLRGQRGGGHPIVPDVVAEARRLIEETTLSFARVAARTGVSTATLCRWRKLQGWVRPGEADRVPTHPLRSRTRRGRPHRADTVEPVRRLLVGTTLSQKVIAARVGVSQERVSAWMRRRRWVRPADAPVHRRSASFAQAGPERRARELYRRAEALAERYGATLARAPLPDPAAIAWARQLADAARAAQRNRRRAAPTEAGRP